MRRAAVIGPRPQCGALTGSRFAQLLGRRLDVDAFAYEPTPEMVPAGSAAIRSADSGLLAVVDAMHVEMVVWLRFPPRAYLRDWLAGLLDVVLNGSEGAARRAQRAGFGDFLRACAAMLQPEAIDAEQHDVLLEQVLLIELHSPEQAQFWLHMQEERVRETEPLRVR